jgi:hypothetical protein
LRNWENTGVNLERKTEHNNNEMNHITQDY